MILGDAPVKRAFYYHVEKRLKTTRDGIPDNLESFHKVLFVLFDRGAEILERRIARNLYAQLGIEFVAHDGWNLVDYIKNAGFDLMLRPDPPLKPKSASSQIRPISTKEKARA